MAKRSQIDGLPRLLEGEDVNLTLCVCGSGKGLLYCCGRADGTLRIVPADLHPPGPVTGLTKAGCYLSSTNNCSGKLNREHWVSKAVLSEIGETIEVDGFSWTPPGIRKGVSANSLTARILCTRHNEAYSPLDTHAGRFMRTLSYIEKKMNKTRIILPRKMIYGFSGEMLEAWMIKVLLGGYFSGSHFNSQGSLSSNFSLNMDLVYRALYTRKFEEAFGLFVRCTPGAYSELSPSVEVMFLCDYSKKAVFGARIVVQGLEFFLIIDNLDGKIQPNGTVMHRPGNISFRSYYCEHWLMFTWETGIPSRGVAIDVLTR